MLLRSLTARLLVSSAVWIAVSLAAAGMLLTILFRGYIESRFDQELFDHIEELVAAAEVSETGRLSLSWEPSDPRFNRPYSGWYWQIHAGDSVVAHSASTWRDTIAGIDPRPGGGRRIATVDGPAGAALRALVHDITLPGTNRHYTFVVAGPASDVDADVHRFIWQLSLTLGSLGAGLLIAVIFQIRFGLHPLRTIRVALADIRAGRARHLPDAVPGEIQPVVRELNALLDHDRGMLQRARTQASDLAHALKNPLTVIANEARGDASERGRILREQAALIDQRIDRHLARARAAGTAAVLGMRTPVADTVAELRFSMELLYKARNLEISVAGLENLFFGGDSHDLEEMLGNLVDNACKWARRQVTITGTGIDGRLRLAIEDDGPGIPAAERKEVLRRGHRLDEAKAGSGLGLDIAQHIAELYQGSLTLGDSALGGLCAILELPAADRAD